jgi:serine/threonine protein kinase
VDWWALGVCLYEFVVGCRPFAAHTLYEIFHNIEFHNLEFPEDTDKHAKHCVEVLLSTVPDERPRLDRLMSEEFRSFFGNMPWHDMSSAVPPFVPEPASPTDTAYFARKFIFKKYKKIGILRVV